jgi:hypothetical protein
VASQLQSVVLRAPGLYGLNFEGEAVQKTPEYAKRADNVAYDASGRLCNRKAFTATSSKEATTLGSNPITVPGSGHTDDLDTDGIADEQRPNVEFTLESGSLPPSAPRFLSATNTAKTFATTDVSTGADTITISNHGLSTTSSITYNDAGGTALAGLVDETTYFAVKVDANTIKVASTAALATAGTTIDLTGTGNNSQYFTDGDKTVTITGTDVRDVAVEETIALSATAGTHNGETLFKTVTKATISTFPSFDVSIGVQINGILTIAHTAHGRAVGDTVTFSGATAGGGIDAAVINASHTVVTVATNSYTIKVLDTVTSTGAIGGSSVVEKFIGLLDYPDIEQLFMYNHSGGNSLIATASVPTASGGSATKKIYVLATPFTDFVDRTGVTVAGGNDWQFANFNDKVIGARTANTMIVATTGNFAAISAASGSTPDGNIVHSAFGRLWAQKGDTGVSKNIIAYSALLDETHWSTGAGEINVLGTAGAVAHGYDELVAVSSFDRFLVAFLRDSIVIYNSPDAPGSLGIEQIIQGVGCIARDSVQRIGNELYFLSATGIRGLKQIIFSTDKVELTEVSKLVRREFVADMTSGNASTIRSNYDPEEGQYWIKAPSGNIWVFDMHTLDDKTPVRITKFINTDWYSFAYDEQETYIGAKGGIGKYDGYQDDLPNANIPTDYICDWESIYADFDNSKLKILKKIGIAVEGASGQQITLKWETDFSGKTGSRQLTIPGAGTLAEWGVAEWNVAEWGGGISLSRLRTSASKEGRVLSVGFQIESSGNEICVEQLSLFMKLGREDR